MNRRCRYVAHDARAQLLKAQDNLDPCRELVTVAEADTMEYTEAGGGPTSR